MQNNDTFSFRISLMNAIHIGTNFIVIDAKIEQ